ncbi:MAG: DUF4011 domain-containing protein [Phycisphaerales bacterium]
MAEGTGASHGGGVLRLAVEYTDRVNFAMQQHGVPLVSEVAITNAGETAVSGVDVGLTLGDGLCEPWSARLERLEAGGTFRVAVDGFGLRAESLALRTEAERATLCAMASAACGSAATARFEVDVLAFDQWPGVGRYPELTASFVTPNHAGLAGLLGAARAALGTLSERDALDGYQSGSRQRAALIGEACFAAMAGVGLGYINPPASFDSEGQRVRLVDRVLRERMGTCLDLSLMLAGLWEQCGLHPVVVLPEGHAMPGFWTHAAHLAEGVIDEPARVRNLVRLGELVVVESTWLTQRGASFGEAVAAAERRLESASGSFCAVDVRGCRKRGVRPLPLREDGAESGVDLSRAVSPAGAAAVTGAAAVLERLEVAERASATGASDVSESAGRIERWQRRLLDLSLRNRLINFRETGRTVRLESADVGVLEDVLSEEGRLEIVGGLREEERDAGFLADELSSGRVRTALGEAESQKRLLTLYRAARSGIEETGANLLHVAIGMLRWYESAGSEAPRLAPLLLLPARLVRHSTGSGYRYELSLTDEPARVNVTLLEKLRVDFGIESAPLSELPEDDRGIDVALALHRFREAIRDSSRWEVEETAFVGLFSFNKFLMWRDLGENLEGLKRNRLVRHLVEGGSAAFDATPLPGPEGLDEEVSPGALLCTRDADSTQLAAVRAASEGRSFVLEGPPGTGKSQTIANIIADALSKGRRVLFVAEKMAALSVVRRRLERDGLGAFCLELHSAKASKREVLAQLGASIGWRFGGGDDGSWSSLCSGVDEARSGLNGYVSALHDARASGESVYEVLGRLTRLGDGPAAPPEMESPAAVERDRLEAWRSAVRGLEERGSGVWPVSSHALRGIGRSAWSFELPDRAAAALRRAGEALESLGRAADSLARAAGLELRVSDLPKPGFQALCRLGALLGEGVRVEASMVDGAASGRVREAVRAAIEVGVARDTARSALLSRWREELLETDLLGLIERVRRAEGMPGPLRLVFGWLARHGLRRYALEGVPALGAVRADLESAREIGRQGRALSEMGLAARGLGARWNGGVCDWDEAARLVSWSESVAACGAALERCGVLGVGAMAATRGPAVDDAGRAAATAAGDWESAWSAVERELSASLDEDGGWLTGAERSIDRWLEGLPGLNAWCAWRAARDEAEGVGLGALVELIEHGVVEHDEIGAAFERGFGERWFVATADGCEALRGFSEAGHSRLVERFRELDTGLIEGASAAVQRALAAVSPSLPAQVSSQSELGVLRRELEKKRRHLPPRRLIEALPNLLPRLKPCFLMSPLSVAQYLDAGLDGFDLVVFDEASQIPVWDAVGAIARGKEVIVVGDSKQLPPTSFFQTVEGDEDDAAVDETVPEDMESILQECNASGVPSLRLGWHYRSRHETLIAFSNHHYYESELHTFPSPSDRSEELGVTLRFVEDGVYDRGGSRTNRVEAERVVAAVVSMLTGPRRDESVGIVTFNLAQQSLIEDLLDAARREHPEIERYFADGVEEPVFVKNLENVQGDERDAIVFSVGYGRDESGRPSMNFGPLNQAGGERRLNVAVTRARRRLVVFSSLRSEDIDLRRTRAVGVRHFKTFLDYAERGPLAIAGAGDAAAVASFEGGFEGAVRRALESRGWSVDARVGCGGYRIDLAVRDPDRPGRYLLGVECDGRSYASARTARDRDRTRSAVLRGLGWRLERVWSTAWRIDASGCLDRLDAAIRAAQASEDAGAAGMGVNRVDAVEVEAAAPAKDDVEPGSSDAAVSAAGSWDTGHAVYTVSRPPRRGLSRVDVFEDRATERGVEALHAVVETEAPVMIDLAVRRLAEWFGVSRVTERFRGRVGEFVALASGAGLVREESGVLWRVGEAAEIPGGFRVPGADEASCRDVEDVPLVERVAVVRWVVASQFGLPREALVREVARQLGASRVTARVGEAIEEAVAAALESGSVGEDGDRIVVSD